MPRYTRLELVLSAFSRGKEQSAAYSFAPTTTEPFERWGTVAVLPRPGQYWLVIHEAHVPSKVDYLEYDVEEHLILPDLVAVEELLVARFRLRLEDLGPSRGNRIFRNDDWPPLDSE